MYQGKKISLVIPCFNEEKGIKVILKETPSFIDEIIVIDNNSTDNTSNISKKFGARVIFEKKKGYGQAYLTGFKSMNGDIIATMDGDNSYSIKEISKLISFLTDNKIDFVSGSRFPLKKKDSMMFLNKLGNRVLTFFFFILTFEKIKDSQSGMWVFKRDVLPRMKLKSKGMAFSEEIKMEAVVNRGIKFNEVPISYSERMGCVKLNKWRDGLVNLFFLFKKRIELFLNSPDTISVEL